MIVVDASTLADALVFGDDRGRKARAVLREDGEWSAPEHWTVEVFSVLRGLALGRKISEVVALDTVERLSRIGIDNVPVDGLLSRMWQLRGGISGYDAAYVALAEARGVTLVTSDARLARAAVPYCAVNLVA